MQWYYVQDGQRVGPIDEMELRMLAAREVIGADTLVWNADLSDWRRFQDVAPASVPGRVPPENEAGICVECGEEYAGDQLLSFAGARVCGECKPVFFQRVLQGTSYPAAFPYAGFWIRFCAKAIDFTILGVLQTSIQMSIARITPSGQVIGTLLFSAMTGLISLLLTTGYNTWFVGRFAATPGKMACGLRVVLSDGSRISYLRAFARSLGEIVSGMVLYIGYIVVAFDAQRRALHDYFCDTRVVRER